MPQLSACRSKRRERKRSALELGKVINKRRGGVRALRVLHPGNWLLRQERRFNHPLKREGVIPASSLTSQQAAGEIPLVNVDERQRGGDARKESNAAGSRQQRLQTALKHEKSFQIYDFIETWNQILIVFKIH